MSSITVSIDLEVSPDALWEILEPIESHVDWMADAEAITFTTDQRRGVGTQFDCLTKVGPIRLTDRMEITEWEPGTAMGVRHRGIVTGEGMFRLQPLDEATRTRFTWSEDLRFPWFLGGRLGELLGGKLVMRAIWRRNLTSLRRLVERRCSPHATTVDLDEARYVSLTTFRADGSPVATPVWITGNAGRYAFTTAATAGKTKRLLADPTVRVQVCTMRGRVAEDAAVYVGTGTVDDTATGIDAAVHAVLDKYGWQMRAIGLSDRLKKWFRRPVDDIVAIHLALSPDTSDTSR